MLHKKKTRIKEWKPDVPISKGAQGYHEAVSHAKHYLEVIDELMNVAVPKVKDNDVVIDFGAGTGVSATLFFKHCTKNASLRLVDNSPSWLSKAFELFKDNKRAFFSILEKGEEDQQMLSDLVGDALVDHVISANTLHLVPDVGSAFRGIFGSLKPGGYFTMQSANVLGDIHKDIILVDSTVQRVHDIALDIVRTQKKFSEYKKDLDKKIVAFQEQRSFIFPDPKDVSFYVDEIKKAGFVDVSYHFKFFKVKYSDWLDFLRVKRLQTGILPEIGGFKPTKKEVEDRDELITKATNILFSEMKDSNSKATQEYFTIGSVYISCQKPEDVNAPVSVSKEVEEETFVKLLEGKTALVTGGSRGIGAAIAQEFARHGARVIINYNKNKERATQVLSMFKEEVSCAALKADVSNGAQVKEMFDVIKKEFGSVDIVVNNAGIISDRTLRKMTREEWDSVINTNLHGAYNVTHNALPILNTDGRVINISSVIGLSGNYGQTNYSAAKSALIGFTKSLAKELGRKNTTVNSIAPGFVETEIVSHLDAKVKSKINEMTLLKRMGRAEEIAKVALFLASKKASYITGETLVVDGGLSI